MMILLRLVSTIPGQSLISTPDPDTYNVTGDIWFKVWQVMYSVLMLSGFAVAFFICFSGSIFQIFGLYYNCHCRTHVSSWAFSADQKVIQLTAKLEPQKTLQNKHYVDKITLAAVVVTGTLCYLGWWYQKVMWRAVAVELGRI